MASVHKKATVATTLQTYEGLKFIFLYTLYNIVYER